MDYIATYLIQTQYHVQGPSDGAYSRAQNGFYYFRTVVTRATFVSYSTPHVLCNACNV